MHQPPPISWHPKPPPPPEPHFLERELAGKPIWVHVLWTAGTLGLYLLVLPFLVLRHAFYKAVGNMLGWAIAAAGAVLYYTLRRPARFLYEQTCRLLGHRVRVASPPLDVTPAPGPPAAGPGPFAPGPFAPGPFAPGPFGPVHRRAAPGHHPSAAGQVPYSPGRGPVSYGHSPAAPGLGSAAPRARPAGNGNGPADPGRGPATPGPGPKRRP
ncbi:hypothetical protein [Actinoplanes sp. NPDC051859]|uniref:hypothetical protein n=1 Tax=Actinoplanes sp. NPDC051859 TaxID=3363909 RepID=UPI00379C2B70